MVRQIPIETHAPIQENTVAFLLVVLVLSICIFTFIVCNRHPASFSSEKTYDSISTVLDPHMRMSEWEMNVHTLHLWTITAVQCSRGLLNVPKSLLSRKRARGHENFCWSTESIISANVRFSLSHILGHILCSGS